MLRYVFLLVLGLLIFEPAGLSLVIPIALTLAGIFHSLKTSNNGLFLFILACGWLIDLFTLVRWGTTSLLLYAVVAVLFAISRVNEELSYPAFLLLVIATYFVRQRILNEPISIMSLILGLITGMIGYQVLKRFNVSSTIQLRRDQFFK